MSKNDKTGNCSSKAYMKTAKVTATKALPVKKPKGKK